MKSTVIHTMKIIPEVYQLIESGVKRFEVRETIPGYMHKGDYVRFISSKSETFLGYVAVVSEPKLLTYVDSKLIQQIASITSLQYLAAFRGQPMMLERGYVFEIDKDYRHQADKWNSPVLQIMKGK